MRCERLNDCATETLSIAHGLLLYPPLFHTSLFPFCIPLRITRPSLLLQHSDIISSAHWYRFRLDLFHRKDEAERNFVSQVISESGASEEFGAQFMSSLFLLIQHLLFNAVAKLLIPIWGVIVRII